MAFDSSGILAIELGSNHLRVLNAALSGHRLRVDDFTAEEIRGAPPESTGQQLDALIARKKVGGSTAAFSLSGPGVLHRLLEFPPMPVSELKLVVEREMKTAGGASEKDVVFDWEVIEDTASGNFKQIRVLVALAPRSQVDRVQRLSEQCHLQLALLTTAPISLLRSLKFVQGEGMGLREILYLGGSQGYLLGIKNGIWNFYREFSSHPSDQKGELLVEEALKEIRRVLLYRRQHYQSEGEMSFLLGGDRGLDELQRRLQEEMGVAAEVLRPGPTLDLDSLGGRAGIFRDLFPSFMIPIGLVAAAHLERGINLIPGAVRKPLRRTAQNNLSFLRRPVWALTLLGFLLVIHFALVRMERHYQKLLQERATLYQQWLPSVEAAERSRSLRGDERLLMQSFGSVQIAEPAWVTFFRVLSHQVPSELVLQSLSLRKDKEAWSIDLKGQVVSPDSYLAQSAFNRFYQAFKGLPQVEEIELLPLSVSTFKEKVGTPGGQIPETPTGQGATETKIVDMEITKTKVEFEIRAQSRRM
jgi:Tfp pilus assembly PilM family ATPase